MKGHFGAATSTVSRLSEKSPCEPIAAGIYQKKELNTPCRSAAPEHWLACGLGSDTRSSTHGECLIHKKLGQMSIFQAIFASCRDEK